MSAYHERMRGLVADIGWADALLYALDRGCRALGSPVRVLRYRLIAQPVAEKPLLSPRRGQSIVTRLLSDSDEFPPETLLSPALVAERRRAGSICIGAFDRERLVGYSWLSIGAHDDELLRARFIPSSPDISWDYDFYVLPSHRLGLAYAKIWDHAFEVLRARNIRWSFSYIGSHNPKSLRSQLRMGAVQVGSFIVVKVGKRDIFLSRVPPLLRVAQRASSRAEFPLIAPRHRA